ncbi:MAG: addiction module protein [Campylobacterales bacterium]
MQTQELIEEAISLPVDERIKIVDCLLGSLNQTQPEIEAAWNALAQKRLADLESGLVQPVDGHTVFEKLWQKVGR